MSSSRCWAAATSTRWFGSETLVWPHRLDLLDTTTSLVRIAQLIRDLFIDWDCAAPGTRLWDLAYAVHGFVPLSADPDHLRSDAGPRLRTFVDAYGLEEQQRRRLVPMLSRRTRSMYDFLLAQWRAGSEPWRTLWREGHGTAWNNDADWIGQRDEHWTKSCSASHDPWNRRISVKCQW